MNNKKKVESFRVTPDGRKYLKQVKAMAMLKKGLLAKKKEIDLKSQILGQALSSTHENLMKAINVPAEEFTYDISLQEEDHA